MRSLCVRKLWASVLVVSISSCATVVMDRSIPALEAGDLSLVHAATEGPPQVGIHALRFKKGDKIDEVWRLFFPVHSAVKGGEVVIYFKNQTAKPYPIKGSVVEIPWKEVVGNDTWMPEHDGLASALAVIEYTNAEGIEETIKMRGDARLIMLEPGYDPMPFGSPSAMTETVCKIQYSTAGRTAVKCDP